MRLDDEQELTLPQMLESARSFPLEVTMPDPNIPTTSLVASTGASKGAITVPECCISLVDGPLVGLSTSDGTSVTLDSAVSLDTGKPGPLDGPGFLEGSNLLDADGALERGLVEGVSAGART